jgi:hypothetical protein
MRESLKQHGTTILVAMVVAAVTAGGTAFATSSGSASVSDRGRAFNALGRLAESHTDSNALPNGNGTVRSVKITTPGPGYLMMVGSSDVFTNGDADDISICTLFIGNTRLDASAREIELNNTDNSEENCNTDSAWPVKKGRHKVSLRASGGDVRYDEATLEVMYVPLNGRGKLPKPKSPTSLSGLVGNK